MTRREYRRQAIQRKQLRGMFSTIRPTSPYPETYKGLPEDMDDWSCLQAAEYYRRLLTVMPESEAWAQWYDDVDRIGFWADATDCCLRSCSFCTEFKKEFGRDWPQTWLENLTCYTGKVIENVSEGGAGAADSIGKILKILPWVAGAGVVYLGGKYVKAW